MSAATEMSIRAALEDSLAARGRLQSAQEAERLRTIEFMDEALAAHWGWKGIGRALGVTDTAARRYYERNRRKVRSV